MNKIPIDVRRVKSIMARNNLSASEVAEKAGTTSGSFTRILREGKCAAFMLGKIANVLGVQPWELVAK